MASLVICWYCRTSQDELAGRPSVIHRSTNMVPNLGYDLPLIDESGGLTIEDEGRIDPSGLQGVGIHIEVDFAGPNLTGGLCLSARLGPLDQDRTN
jgi:hypothetical protein